MAQEVENLPAKQDMQVRSLGRGGILKEEMATHSSILAWKIPWTEEPGYSPLCHKELDMTEWLSRHSALEWNSSASQSS